MIGQSHSKNLLTTLVVLGSTTFNRAASFSTAANSMVTVPDRMNLSKSMKSSDFSLANLIPLSFSEKCAATTGTTDDIAPKEEEEEVLVTEGESITFSKMLSDASSQIKYGSIGFIVRRPG